MVLLSEDEAGIILENGVVVKQGDDLQMKTSN